MIQDIVGETVQVIDPAPAIARQTQRLLEKNGWLSQGKIPSRLHFFTSGDPQFFFELLAQLMGENGPVEQVKWDDLSLLS